MTRKELLGLLSFAGYHTDSQAFTRLVGENRISLAKAREAAENGARARQRGIKCGCRECRADEPAK